MMFPEVLWTTPSIPCNANWNRNGGTWPACARSHAGLCAARIRALEGLLGDLRCSGRRLCMDCGEEIPLSRLLAVPGACRCHDCQQLAEEEARPCDRRPPWLPDSPAPAAPLR